MRIKTLEEYGHSSKTAVYGSIKDVVEGNISDDHMQKVNSKSFSYGFGGASFDGLSLLGDSILINQTCYISRQLQGKGLKCFAKKADFYTPFFVGMETSQKPYSLIEVDRDKIGLDELFQEILMKHSNGFCIVGEALFNQLESLYIRAPLSANKSFYDNFETYVGSESRQLALGFIVAIVAPNIRIPSNEDLLNRILYQNSGDIEKESFRSHAHIALLNERDRGNIELERDIVGVRHLLNKSTISYGKFKIFKL
ncbi:MAG: hypothetical protein P0S95_07405 [Rhabdochlamydiaceae bacterium]|nr:hypothetical protein [Candidatus Amphrikana amoebophyrae]